MLEAIAVLQILHGSASFIPHLTQKGLNAFITFFNTIIVNGIEETQPLVKKIEIAGLCQLLMNEPSFYQQQQSLGVVSNAIVVLFKVLNKDNVITISNFTDVKSFMPSFLLIDDDRV